MTGHDAHETAAAASARGDESHDARIRGRNGFTVGAQELGGETVERDAQVVAGDEERRKAGETDEARQDLGALFRRHPVSFIEGVEIFARDELAGFVRERGGGERLELRSELLVRPRGEGQARQEGEMLGVAGDRIDIYISQAGGTELLASDVVVIAASTGAGGLGGGDTALLLAVDAALARDLVAAVHTAELDLVRRSR